MSLVNELEHNDPSVWYGAASKALSGPLQYKWNDDKPTEHYNEENHRLEKELAQPPMRAGLSATIGFAEWIWLRLRHATKDSRFPELIEAAWASVIDWRYLNASNQVQNEASERKRGQIEGPLSIAFRHLLTSILDASNETGFYSNSVYISNLAEHVVSDQGAFKKWRGSVIKRLKTLYPDDPNDLFGPPVPREAIVDPKFDVAASPKLLNAFLGQLKPNENPFLSGPDEMKAKGFEGVPYQFPENK